MKNPRLPSTTPRPRGCDTFVAFPPATPQGVIIFGKNSDRPEGEGQSIRRYPRTTHFDTSDNAEEHLCQCTYIAIPQIATTHAVLLSQIDWMVRTRNVWQPNLVLSLPCFLKVTHYDSSGEPKWVPTNVRS
jgi:hypothetical protein